MKLTVIILFCTLLQVSAASLAQTITLKQRNVTLEKVFTEIRKQTGYNVLLSAKQVNTQSKVDANFDHTALTEVLDKCLNRYNLTYTIEDKTIVVAAKESTVLEKIKTAVTIPITVSGKVTDTTGTPLPGATIKNVTQNTSTATANDGTFSISSQLGDQITVSFVGYAVFTFIVKENLPYQNVTLHTLSSKLNEVVVSTGLQILPKERSTGSFAIVDSALFNRRVSTNVLDHLNGVTSGVYFNGTQQARNLTYGSSSLGINVRGQSTLSSSVNKDPLVVLDNFPYEGNLNNLNPNDIESITVLKDAAAASIWGARSGNGVIVITTKKGKVSKKPVIEFNASTTIGNKPNLLKDKKFIDAASTYIDIENYLYTKGYFNSDIANTTSRPALSPVIDILASTLSQSDKSGQINAIRNVDYRNDYSKYFYQKSINQQYSLGIRGGSNNKCLFHIYRIRR